MCDADSSIEEEWDVLVLFDTLVKHVDYRASASQHSISQLKAPSICFHL